MGQLPQLKNSTTYRPCEWDLKADRQGRRYWVDLFCGHIDTLMAAISEAYPETAPGKLASFRSEYVAAMRAFDTAPDRFEHIDILTMDELRTDLQSRYGFYDPYRKIKARENRLALAVLPELLEELDASPAEGVVEKLAFGLMAGNIFDLGAHATVERCREGGCDFRQLRAGQPPRPWFIDSLDAWRKRWADGPAYEHVAFFVDNGGSDACLGCVPLARWLLREGSRITLVANSRAALNDVTAPELAGLLEEIAQMDTLVATARTNARLSVTASGGRTPLIDLTHLADACVDAIADADLIILHGMGRAIESNFQAAFSCDALRVAVLKDSAVARRIGGRVFDCLFWFEAAG
ncbi:MAG: ARMT1-like domain-containing protein [Phycisphaerae bacterium]